jgi:hypothetical protein
VYKTVEITGIELTGARKKKKLLQYTDHLAVYYMNFFVHLINILQQLVQKDCYIILVRDLNIHIPEKRCGHRQLLDVTDIYNLTRTIITATCLTESMATVIDQIITNMHA